MKPNTKSRRGGNHPPLGSQCYKKSLVALGSSNVQCVQSLQYGRASAIRSCTPPVTVAERYRLGGGRPTRAVEVTSTFSRLGLNQLSNMQYSIVLHKNKCPLCYRHFYSTNKSTKLCSYVSHMYSYEDINCSFCSGIFPNALKIAKVVPIFKKGEKGDVANYRPISVLPFFAKIFEKLMYERLSNFLEKANIIFPSQHGFQAGHSPSMPLLSIQDKISEAIENNEYSLGVFFDLAKAFDTVNHNILLKKLNNYGIRGAQLNWFASYLEDRSQLVHCNGASSMMRAINFGVPQGSCHQLFCPFFSCDLTQKLSLSLRINCSTSSN